MALLEAQASGLPVIAGASGGVDAIVTPGTTGLLAPPGDIDTYAAAVRTLILDPETRAMMGAAAQRNACCEHDLREAADRLGAIIERLCRKRAA
jgi:glycosyltransferase involved in cell wall biosynthesis